MTLINLILTVVLMVLCTATPVQRQCLNVSVETMLRNPCGADKTPSTLSGFNTTFYLSVAMKAILQQTKQLIRRYNSRPIVQMRNFETQYTEVQNMQRNADIRRDQLPTLLRDFYINVSHMESEETYLSRIMSSTFDAEIRRLLVYVRFGMCVIQPVSESLSIPNRCRPRLFSLVGYHTWSLSILDYFKRILRQYTN